MIAHNSPNSNDEGVFISSNGKDAWLQTYTGGRVSVMNPQPDQINIYDIGVALSKQCRFNGHCSKFYSVAEHCVRGSWLAEDWYGKEVAKEFFLHDATEAYMGDMIRPVKRMIPQFEQMEQVFWKAISSKFGVPYIHSEEVHYLDNVMVTWEKRDLLPHAEEWPNLPDISNLGLARLDPHTDTNQIEEIFLTQFTRLFGESVQ